jgi:hypothetical protein
MTLWIRTHPRLVFLLFYALFLLAIETGLRQWWVDGAPSTDGGNIVPDALVHHDYRPNISFTTKPYIGDSFPPTHNQINALGLRGPIPTAKKNRRILVLGDSFVQADEVHFAQTFGQQLNVHFAPQLYFVAHGMVSWSPTTEFSWLHHKGLALAPDEVVLFLCINDFYRPAAFHQTDAIYRRQAVYEGELPISYSLPTPSLTRRAIEHSALLRLLHLGYRSMRIALRPPTKNSALTIPSEILHLAQPQDKWPNALRANVDSTLAVVAAINRYLQRRGILLHTTLVPLPFAWPDECALGKQHPLYAWSADFSVSQAGIEKHVRTRMAQQDIGWIDLHAAFVTAKQSEEALLFNEVDGHWNAAGHRIVFGALRNYFTESKSRE